MQFLPIIERELRAAVRRPKTWWWRIGTLGLALLLLAMIYQSVRRYMNAGMVGREVFSFLSGFGMVFAILAGPLATVDCIARERREGTLGLLFLTNLNTFDVVMGKMAAAALDMLMTLAAVLPLMAIPFLLGGMSLQQCAYAAISIFQIMFFSLALGMAASALMPSGLAAMALTVLILTFVTVGLPLLGEVLFHIPINGRTARYFYGSSPLYLMNLCISGRVGRGLARDFYFAVAQMHVLSWLCLAVTCWRTRLAWRDQPTTSKVTRWRQRFERLSKGAPSTRLKWRAVMLNRNPFAWLDGRDRGHHRVLIMLLGLATAWWFIGYLHKPRDWTNNDALVLFVVATHYVLCLWTAIWIPRRLAEDKHSGALELLLCSPLQPAMIIRGSMLLFSRRFGRMLVILLMLYWFMLGRHITYYPTTNVFHDDLIRLAEFGLPVFLLQLYCLAQVGIYQALASGNSLRASLILIAKLCLLPWALFITSMITYESLRRKWPRVYPDVDDLLAYSIWAGSHVICCSLPLVVAVRRLKKHFRGMASNTVRFRWWTLKINSVRAGSSA